MRIELLHIADCPNWEVTFRRLKIAAEKAFPAGTSIDDTLIDSAEQAGARPFAGSPTILVDGIDLFPSEGRTDDLACRIYFTPGGMAGAPTQEQIEEALKSRG
jgi:hypothetical protein